MLELRDFYDFSITNWYEKFRDITPETILIPLPKELVQKIQNEDLQVDVDEHCTQDFIETVNNALNTFGKKVFVKNNWHAPTDAKMFNFGNNLEACNIRDIFLYLSNSIIIQDDFDLAQDVSACIALRQWINIHPAAEFRCIVINNILRGLTPRDWPTFYAHYKVEGKQILAVITKFYNDQIRFKFPRNNYIVDLIYSYPDKPYVLDFGPLNNKTNLYAFTWKEIQPLINRDCPGEVAPVFRFLETDIGIMAKAETLYKFSRSHD